MSLKKSLLKNILLLASPPIGLFLYIAFQSYSGELTREEFKNAGLFTGMLIMFVGMKVSYSLSKFCVNRYLPTAPNWLKNSVGVLFALFLFISCVSVI